MQTSDLPLVLINLGEEKEDDHKRASRTLVRPDIQMVQCDFDGQKEGKKSAIERTGRKYTGESRHNEGTILYKTRDAKGNSRPLSNSGIRERGSMPRTPREDYLARMLPM